MKGLATIRPESCWQPARIECQIECCLALAVATVNHKPVDRGYRSQVDRVFQSKYSWFPRPEVFWTCLRRQGGAS